MFTYNMTRLPFVGMTGRTREKPGWSHSGRYMVANLITIFHKGECTFRINETDYSFTGGDVVIVPKGSYYKPHTDTFCEYTFFHFDGDLLPCETDKNNFPFFNDTASDKSFYGLVGNEYSPLYFDYKMNLGDKKQEISTLLNKCINTRTSFANMHRTLLSIHFSEILFHISEAFCQQYQKKSDYPASLNKILYFIQENYTGNIQLDDICKHINVSKQYCMRLFKKYMNMTINDYILEMRMKHAAYLMLHTYMNVNQVADYLGFANVSYFSRVFKKYYCVPPTLYLE